MKTISLTLFVICLSAMNAHAYIGPGMGVGTIATILGVIGAIFLGLFAVIYYPIKRAIKARKKSKNYQD